MKVWQIGVAGGLVALAVLVTGVASRAQTPPAATPAPAPTRIATINMVKMFNGLDEKKRGDAEMDALSKRLQDEQKSLEEEVNRLNSEIKEFKQDTEQFRATQEQLFKKAMELESHMRVSEQKLMLEQRLRTMSLYRKMNKAIADYSAANGIAIVFVADDVDFTGAKTPGDVIGRITLRKVAYAHESLDITIPLINKMNAEFSPPVRDGK